MAQRSTGDEMGDRLGNGDHGYKQLTKGQLKKCQPGAGQNQF